MPAQKIEPVKPKSFLRSMARTLVFMGIMLIGIIVASAYIHTKRMYYASFEEVNAQGSPDEEGGDGTTLVRYTFQGQDYISPLLPYATDLTVNQGIKVYVSPQKPEEAYKDRPQDNGKHFFYLGLVLGFCIIALIFCMLGLSTEWEAKKMEIQAYNKTVKK